MPVGHCLGLGECNSLATRSGYLHPGCQRDVHLGHDHSQGSQKIKDLGRYNFDRDGQRSHFDGDGHANMANWIRGCGLRSCHDVHGG